MALFKKKTHPRLKPIEELVTGAIAEANEEFHKGQQVLDTKMDPNKPYQTDEGSREARRKMSESREKLAKKLREIAEHVEGINL